MKSAWPLPSRSSSMRARGCPPTMENDALSGAAPVPGCARRVSPLSPWSATLTITVWVTVLPVGPVATAVRAADGGGPGTLPAKVPPWTAATIPLTVTPISAPPDTTVPRTSSAPEGTVAPPLGSVIGTCCVDTVKLRWAGVWSSLPARSRALTAKPCAPGVNPDSVAVGDPVNPPKGPPSRRHANTSPLAGERLSAPPKVNVALVAAIVSFGPPVICVSGGVLSTMTVRLAGAVLRALAGRVGPVRGAPFVALAASVCTPSAAEVVLQLAVAVTALAGGPGAKLTDSG